MPCAGLLLNDHIDEPGDVVFRHACRLGLEGIVSKRLGSRYRSGRSKDWLKFKNPDAPRFAVSRKKIGGATMAEAKSNHITDEHYAAFGRIGLIPKRKNIENRDTIWLP
jgi:ATP-dependent DNA ligase